MNKRVRVKKNGKTLLRSRVVMEEHIGRALNHDECVHHINKIVDDDRIENLKIISRSEHARQHNTGRKEVVIDTRTNEERTEWVMKMWENKR